VTVVAPGGAVLAAVGTAFQSGRDLLRRVARRFGSSVEE
jgi:hypothetical protein